MTQPRLGFVCIDEGRTKPTVIRQDLTALPFSMLGRSSQAHWQYRFVCVPGSPLRPLRRQEQSVGMVCLGLVLLIDLEMSFQYPGVRRSWLRK